MISLLDRQLRAIWAGILVVIIAGATFSVLGPASGQPTRGRNKTPIDLLYEGRDPARNLQTYKPTPLDVVLHPRRLRGLEERRAIRLRARSIELVRGAAVLRRIPFDATRARGFGSIVDKIQDPAWVERMGRGKFLLRSAFVQAPRTSVVWRPPDVRLLRLAARPHVFLGGVEARATLDRVRVTSWNVRTRRPDRRLSDGRPFISYGNDSRLDIIGAEISSLGFDATTAYGLAWRSGSTGSVVDSEIDHNFFGLYTFEAVNLEIRNNVFRDSVFYGIDPHDFSSGLVIEGNEAYRNGAHGIIFSKGVTNSIVRNNYSHHNRANGIVMDYQSNGNLVTNNRVEHNNGDGIVVLGSNQTVVRSNLVRANRVGIRVNQVSAGTSIVDNRIEANARGVELYGGARETDLSGNRVADSSEAGMVLEAPSTHSVGDSVAGSPVGIEVRSLVDISAARITKVGRGVEVSDRGIANLRRLRIQATHVGLRLASDAIARLQKSTIEAPEPIIGRLRDALHNKTASGPRVWPWLPIAGAGFVIAAIGLEGMRAVRSRTVPPPATTHSFVKQRSG
jgi:parallel beta-helix repeat protein